MRIVAQLLIRLYQLTLSPWLGRSCRFYPTCSNYALEALELHGVWRGGRTRKRAIRARLPERRRPRLRTLPGRSKRPDTP